MDRSEVVWLGEIACHDVALVGGKAAQLSRLAARHSVPPGFCLTTTASALGAGDDVSVGIAGELRQSLLEAYATLGERVATPDVAVAVRSSAADEDGQEASCAGQHETFLNITGGPAVLEAIAGCLESAGSDQAAAYRKQQGLDSDDVRVAVLIQQLVPADASAVAFSLNPVTGSTDEVVINANWGLGESVVSGEVNPDMFVVGKSNPEAVTVKISEKSVMTVPMPGGTREVNVPQMMRRKPALTDAQASELAALCVALEAEMGWPVDIEVAFRDERLYLLQCRPITTVAGNGAGTGPN